MSVSLLPPSIFPHLRSLLVSLSSRSPLSPVGDLRSELSSLIRLYGNAARLALIQAATYMCLHEQTQQPHKAIEQLLVDEVNELMKREPYKWPTFLAKVFECADPLSPLNSSFPTDSLIPRFAASASLSLRHTLTLAVQLQRSTIHKLQHAALLFLSNTLTHPQFVANLSADKKTGAAAAVSEELLHDLSYLVTSHPAFPLDQKQTILQALAKVQAATPPVDKNARDEASDLVSGVSSLSNSSTGSQVAEVLQDLGYSISSSTESLKEALHPFPQLNEADVASILIMILRTQFIKLHQEGGSDDAAKSSSTASTAASGKNAKNAKSVSSSKDSSASNEGWQIHHVIDAIKELTSGGTSSNATSKLNWKQIFEVEMDQRRFFIPDEKTYLLYVELYRYATTGVASSSSTFHLPLDFMLREWKFPTAQSSLLRWALPSTLTVFSYLPPNAQANAMAMRNGKSILPAANSGSGAASSGDAAASAAGEETSVLMSLSSSNSSPPSAGYRYQSWLSVDLLESLLESVPSTSTAASVSASSSQSSSVSSAQSLYATLRSLLSVSLERYPELLLSGLLSVRQKRFAGHNQQLSKEELLSVLLPVHVAVAPHPTVAQAFQKLTEAATVSSNHANALAAKASVFWVLRYWLNPNIDPSSGSTGLLPPLLLSLGYSLKSTLEKLLQSSSTPFVLDLFTTAPNSTSSAPAHITFKQWLMNKYTTELTSNASKELFLSVLFQFIKENLSDAPNSGNVDAASQPFRLSVETIAVFFATLLSLSNAPSSLMNEIQNYFSSHASAFAQFQPQHMNMVGTTIHLNASTPQANYGFQQQHPQGGMNPLLMNPQAQAQQSLQQLQGMGGFGAPNRGMDLSHQSGSAPAAPSDDIEEEANSYFQQIYTGALSLDQVVEMLMRFKNSSNKRERDVAGCMVHNLFDEYRFFHKYPPKELQITGLLFGALIQNKLVTNFTLGIALRFVLEALRKPPDSKMFSFGLWAIQQFRSRIAAWPQYAMLILHIPQLQQAQPELYAFLASIVQTHQSQGTLEQSSGPGSEVDFSTSGSSAFGVGFHSDAQSFSNFASLSEAERHADMTAAAAAAAKVSGAPDSVASSHLPPPGLGLGGAPKVAAPTPVSAGLLGAAGAASNAPSNTSTPAPRTGTPATATTPAGAPSNSSFGSTLNIDSLLSAEGDAPLPLAPSESLKDKIHFIINSVTKSNLRQKGRELKLILRPEFLPYFSRYLVIKRVSIEANFQRLYASFLDYVGIPELRKIMLETTYYNIQVLLRNDKIVSSSSERSLLKNLGSWLGLLTIAKNKPIRARYLDLKTLILEAYDAGRLIAVIPFSAKVLESCADSRVFKPPNPWLMAVVGLLREIFDLPGLKLNLKFEIEVLFNHLQLNMKEVRSTNLLKTRPLHPGHQRDEKGRAAGQQAQGQGNMANRTPFPLLPTPNPLPPLPKTGVPPLKSAGGLGLTGLGGGLGGVRSPSPSMSEEEALRIGISGSDPFAIRPSATGTAAAAANAPLTAANADSLLIPNLNQYVVISSSITLFQMYPALKRLVPTAIDRAIREIINPVVERSLAIACVTTRELILKDFALESDENKMRLASNSMVSNLTSSLALVTCREPLRVSISNHLQQLLESNTNPTERALVERACLQISAENLELCSTLIEKAAAERAIREIDEQLAPVYQMRRKHRETTGQGYIDMSFFQPGNRYPAQLPEALRAKPGQGLSPSQLRVYEDFNKIRSQHAAAAAAAPQTGSERPNMKEGVTPVTGAASTAVTGVTSTTTGVPGSVSALARTEEEKKAAALSASAFAAPRAGAPMPTTTGGPQVAGAPAPGAQQSRSPPLGAQQPSNLTAQQTLDKLLGYLATLEQAVLRFPNHKSIPLHSLTTAVAAGTTGAATGQREDQEINVLMRLMAGLLQQTARDESSYPKDLVPLTFALKVFKRLYERENRSSLLQIDVHIGALKLIRSVCPKLLPELTAWLLYADDDRKFILPITAGLLRARLLNTAELDLFLSKLASNIFTSGQAVATTTQPNPAAPAGSNQTQQVQVLHPQFEFILTLVRRVVVKRPIVSVAELSNLLETLNKIGQQAAQQRTKLLADHIAHLLEDVRMAALVAEKERAEQERQLRVGDGLDGAKGVGADASLLSGILPPLSLLDTADEVDSLDRMVDEPEPAGLRQQVMYLLDDWLNICLQQNQASDKAYSAYLGLLQQQRLLATPDATQKFFRVIIQLCVDSALQSTTTPATGDNAPASISYTAIDALSKLFVFLLKWGHLSNASDPSQNPPSPNTTASKIALLRSFLSAAVYVLRKDQALKNTNASAGAAAAGPVFNQRPYLRLFNNLLHDLNTPDPLLDSNNVEVLVCFAQHFRFLRPQRCPAFLFAWLELISHRMFMSKLLISKTPGCSALFARLLVDLFRFLQPYLRQADLTEVLRLAYKGTLRLLLVLLHDFPEFLCEYHFSFCDVIPSSCIQMRNLILSAFPRSMRLPDPFTPNLKVDLLDEMKEAPRISSDITSLLQQPQHRHSVLLPLEQYLKHREPQTFFKQLLDNLTLRAAIFGNPNMSNPPPSAQQLEAAHTAAVKRAGTTWNVPLINAVVMYTGLTGLNILSNSANKPGLVTQFQDSSSMDVYEALLAGLDAEGRYYVLNAIANQLRFPNSHTHYFSCVLLYLFLQCKDEILMEQITRVLLERLIVHRPHPWGLLITFIELIKNPRYAFWSQPFTRCAPEIERLFDSVARSCIPVKTASGAPAAAQPGSSGSALGSSVGAGNSAAAQAMMNINDTATQPPQ